VNNEQEQIKLNRMSVQYRSFAITVRPRSGLNEKTQDALLTWIKQRCDHGILVTEGKNESKHAHLQMWNNEGRTRGVVSTAIQRICERTVPEWDRAQQKVMRDGIRIAYSDWFDDYLTDNLEKTGDDKGIVHYENIPEKTLDFYPTEEDQEKLKKKCNAVDPKYFEMNDKYSEYLKERDLRNNIVNCSTFLSWAMFKAKIYRVIEDPRKRRFVCESLWRYNDGEPNFADCLTREQIEMVVFDNMEKKKQVESSVVNNEQ